MNVIPLLILNLILLETSPIVAQSAKKVIVHGYGQCNNANSKNLPVSVRNGVLIYRLQNFILSGNLTITEDLPKDFYVSRPHSFSASN